MGVFTTYNASIDAAGTGLLSGLLGQNSGLLIEGAVTLSASAATAVNIYDGSLTSLGIGAGFLLSSGMAPGIANTVDWFGQDNSDWMHLDPTSGLPVDFFNGNPMIDAVVNTVFQTQSYDATTLSFNFKVSNPAATSISIDVVFGSDEYPEWVDQFVDCAVVIVNGVNYALFNHDPLAPLSVISTNLAAGYFQDNAANQLPIEYDGVSHVLKILAPIKPSEVNSITIGIADTGDHIYDSGIFIANMTAGTTPGSGVVITPDVPCTDGSDAVTGTVADELIYLLGGNDIAYASGGDDIVLAGNGNDSVYGGSGNDVLEGDEGNDYLDGGEGVGNIAVYAGDSLNYTVTYNSASDTYAVSGADGTDTLKSIQLLKFSNGLFDLSQAGLSMHASDPGAPANQVGSVAISGAAMVGQTLTAIVIDSDGLSTGGVTYDWQTSVDGFSWVSTGVTTKSYTLSEGDAGLSVMVLASYTDNADHTEWPSSAAVKVATKVDLALSLIHLSAPEGAGVMNPLTTLLDNAIALGFTANKAATAIQSVLSLPDVNLRIYDPVAVLDAQPLGAVPDPTALMVLKVCGELAMAASASDPSAFNLTLAVMDAAAHGQTIHLADPAQLEALLIGIGATELKIVKTTNKDMHDAHTVAKILAAWDDFCGNTDGMEQYLGSLSHFNVDLNQPPVGYSTVVLPVGSPDTPYTINTLDLLSGFSDPDGDQLSIIDVTPNVGGFISNSSDSTWTFVPDAGFTGPVEIGFTVSDPSGAAVTGNAIFAIVSVEPALAQDTTAPTVSSIAFGANNGLLKAGQMVDLIITLSEAVVVNDTLTLALANGGLATCVDGSGTSILTFSYTAEAGQDTADLSTAATAALSGALTDAAGNAVVAAGFDDVSSGGTLCVDTIAPAVESFGPANGDTNFTVGTNLVVTFAEAIDRGTGTISIRLGSATGSVIESFDSATSTRLDFSGATLTIDPAYDFTSGTNYFVVFSPDAVTDVAGNAYAGISTYGFTTASLQGKVYDWKSHALLKDVNLKLTPQGDGTQHLFEIQNMHPTAGGDVVADVWANFDHQTIQNLDFKLALPDGVTGTFMANATSLTGFSSFIGSQAGHINFSAMSSGSSLSGAVLLGELTLDLPAGIQQSSVQFLSGDAGNMSLPAYAVNVGGQITTTDVHGSYAFSPSESSLYDLGLGKPLTSAAAGSPAITSADALQALRLAVGRRPEGDVPGATVASPYQFIAADINGDGKVTCSDALAILKMAADFSDAPASEWLFVREDQDFWDESAGKFITSRSNVVWDKSPVSIQSSITSQQNFVAVLKGDVNGSGSAVWGDEKLNDSYFENLVANHPTNMHLSQWGIKPTLMPVI